MVHTHCVHSSTEGTVCTTQCVLHSGTVGTPQKQFKTVSGTLVVHTHCVHSSTEGTVCTTHCVHSGTAGSPQKQVMTVAYWLVTLVQCGFPVRQWYACGTLVSHICTPVHWYSVPVVQWGSPVPVALLARHPLESSLADDQIYSLPYNLGIHCHRPTPGNASQKILSCFDIALILTLLSLS